MMKFTFGIDPSSPALFLGTKDCGIQWTNDGIYRWVAGERKEIDFEGFVLDPASSSAATFDLQPVVRCTDCEQYIASWCHLFHCYRKPTDYCSSGKRRGSDG